MIKSLLSTAETTLLLSVAALYIVQCPFNKVEESFNTQAVHDIINIFPQRLPSSNHTSSINTPQDLLSGKDNVQEVAIRARLQWDHVEFPGVVPRTFVGALFIGLCMKIAKVFMSNQMFYGPNPDGLVDEHDLTLQFILQVCSRFALACLMSMSIGTLLRSIQRRYGISHRICFLIITVSQFHYIFYSGRFIPNTYAAILSNLVLASWINRQYSKSIVYMAFCAVVFRFDTALFFGCLLIDAVFVKRILTVNRVFAVGMLASLISLMVSFVIDSIFWARPIWPEFEGFYFNALLNKSHEWGTAPYFWYIYNCIPRIMMTSTPLLLLSEHKFTRDYLIPTLVFILAFSLLPHKELRFILYVIPFLNMCATSGLLNILHYLNVSVDYTRSLLTRVDPVLNDSELSPRRRQRIKQIKETATNKKLARGIFAVVVLFIFSANILASYIMARVSSYNYPGGQAAISLGVTKRLLDGSRGTLNHTDDIFGDYRSNVGVYVGNLAAQTGMSRFVQVDGIFYSKTPRLDATTFKQIYDDLYLILEPTDLAHNFGQYCSMIKSTHGNDGANIYDQLLQEGGISCRLPNQGIMKCTHQETINSFMSVNIGGFIRKLKQVRTPRGLLEALDDKNFIRTREALYIISCSKKG